MRAFIAENYPAEMRVPNPEIDLTKEQSLLWHRILHKRGLDRPALAKAGASLRDHPYDHETRSGDGIRRGNWFANLIIARPQIPVHRLIAAH